MIVQKLFVFLFFSSIASASFFFSVLDNWLEQIIITIPTLSAIEYDFNITVYKMTCTGIQINGIKSSYSQLQLNVSVDKLTLHCHSDFTFEEQGFPWLYGSGEVTVYVNSSSVTYGLELMKGEHGIANRAITTQCIADIMVTDMVSCHLSPNSVKIPCTQQTVMTC